MKNQFKISVLLSLLSTILFLFSLLLGQRSGTVVVVTYVGNTSLLFVLMILMMATFQNLLISRFRIISFYLSLLLSFTFSVGTVLTFQTPMFLFMFLSLILEVLSSVMLSQGMELRTLRYAVSVISLVIMIYLGNLFQFAYNRPGTGILLDSTQSVFVVLGQNVPLLERQGLFIFSTYFDAIVSIQQFILFSIISVIISENYYQIVKFLGNKARRRGKGSMFVFGIAGALSCQCESYIAFLPAFSILLVDYILFPSIILSIILLSLTYYLVRKVYSTGRKIPLQSVFTKKRKDLALIIASAIILITTPVFITLVVYFSLLSNALYFFSTGMIMIIDGYVMSLIFSRLFKLRQFGIKSEILFVLIGSLIIFLWFYPDMTFLAYTNSEYFVLMSACMLTGGLIYGYVFSSVGVEWKEILNEYISTIFGVFSLITFYVMATFQIKIWPFFSLQSQVEFALITWIIMLPVMWVTTQISLSRIASSKPTDLKPVLVDTITAA